MFDDIVRRHKILFRFYGLSHKVYLILFIIITTILHCLLYPFALTTCMKNDSFARKTHMSRYDLRIRVD